MKILSLLVLGIASIAFGDGAAREIQMHTQKTGDAVHWVPEVIEVTQGETVRFVAKHELEGGFNFHGFEIAPLKIRKQVDRGKPLTVEATVPSSLKPGDYEIGCQFHPKHVPAKLVVKTRPSAAASPAPGK